MKMIPADIFFHYLSKFVACCFYVLRAKMEIASDSALCPFFKIQSGFGRLDGSALTKAHSRK